MELTSVIQKPIVTEKSAKLAEGKKYTFIVDRKATKTQIREAFKLVYGVTVKSIGVANWAMRRKRQWKGRKWVIKAVVEIVKGEEKVAKLFKF
jgi:large subunit ribosomal protein L23